MVNEDTQGNVSQLQAEVKRLKEQLAQLTTGHILPGSFLSSGKMSAAFSVLRETARGYERENPLTGVTQQGTQSFPQVPFCLFHLHRNMVLYYQIQIPGTEFWERSGKGEEK